MKKTCIVTGGANGIGRAITETFIDTGYDVLIIDTDEIAGKKLRERFGGDKLFFYHGDIAEQAALDGFVQRVTRLHGKIDVLVNNACISRGGIDRCTYDDFNYVLRVGVGAPFYLSQQLLSYFADGASIVNISSTRAAMSQANTESYTAAKGGISALTHALSVSLAGRVRVNSISPGWIDTGANRDKEDDMPKHSKGDLAQHPAGRVGTPRDIAQMALFLCSDKAGFITGENITIDGGMTKLMVYHNDNGWVYKPE